MNSEAEATMDGYCGSDIQQRLQQRSDESAALTLTRPGACNVGRMIGCDDIVEFGWPAVFDVLEGNALMVEAAFAAINAEMIYEIVSDSNVPSRRMVEASGLRLAENLKSGIVVRNGGAGRFTR